MMFSHRLIKPELLDSADPDEARGSLADLVRINCRLGGHASIRKLLASVAVVNESFTVLDVGAASGDTANLIRHSYPFASVTSLDRHYVNLSAAPEPKLIADAFQLPFPERSFDFVICSLFLHHFADEKVVQLLRAFYMVSRKALLISDLERSILAYWFLPATKYLLGWNRLTLHDGPISVRAGFRVPELLSLAERAGITGAQARAYRPAYRVTMIVKR